MRAIRCSSQRVDFDFTVEKHATAAEVFEGKKMEPFSKARGRQLTHNCQQPAIIGHSAVIAVRYEKPHTSQKRVQSHDILYRVSQDILYTPARAQQAREMVPGWLGGRWSSGNNGCGLWWRRIAARRRWPSFAGSLGSRVRLAMSGCGVINRAG